MIVRALALAGALCAAAPAAAQQAVTKAELRGEAPEITDAKLRGQLWRMFRKEDRRRAERPVRPLDSVVLQTPAYPTAVQGLCRADMVVMMLAPVRSGKGDADAATPMRAYGLESSKRFRILDLTPDQRGAAFGDKWHGPCSRIAENDPRYFQAADETVASEGHALLLRGAAAAQAGFLVPSCDVVWEPGRRCIEALTAFAAQPFESVDDCSDARRATCYKFVSGDDVEVTLWQDAGGPLRASLASLIILRHPRPD
ncbi:hypothetical protein [Sphingomonas kyeonggiensis]|uniref:Uncharacterized protein n=1 Tax=Sphingomonas kyeonggiensis TaxID=1268553 RepID=A0A7W6JQN6_9SPHN|nr:hypothetical protein [Sphingomonas kyeonggiensis]MBB4096710.1 hypothetical protein [Sphingomonas kyeonggiensis]